MNPIYNQRGGGWYGFMLQGSWPFARLEIYDGHLVFSVAAAKRILLWSDIDYSKRLFVFPFLADGVVIVPKDREPKLLIFWALNPSKILSILKSKGVNTEAKFTKDVLPAIVFARLLGPVLVFVILRIFGIV